MNTSIIKRKLIIFLVSGLVFASTMAGFDYMGGTQFNIGKFILFFVGFGGFMSLVIIRKPQTKSQQNKK